VEVEKPKTVKEKEDFGDLEKYLLTQVKDQKPGRLKILADVFKAAIKLAQESPGTLNLKITASTLRELRYSFKTFYPYRHIPKITMFGSARVPPGTPLYEFAKKFGSEAVKRNFLIITGGGPGIMAAGNEGAEKKSFGLNIRLPVEQSANKFIDADKMLIHYKYFFTRKLFLVKEAAAFAFFPGGFGTFDEAFEVLTLLQTGKSTLFPVVMMEPEGFGYWTKLTKFMDEVLLKKGFVSASDKYLYRIFHTPKEALDHIETFYRNYHSMRFVGDKLVIRLKKKLPAAIVAKLQRKFPHISKGQEIVQTGPLPEEMNEPEIKDLARLVFPFDRSDYGELRAFVDFINENTV